MADNKHKIFSKEELFKFIDERKSLPPDADDFDKEALEGLTMLTDRTKLEKLDSAIDEVLRKEKMKARRKRNLYILSAAASLILIVGLFFLLKDTTVNKEEDTLAETSKTVVDLTNTEIKTSDEKAPEEKKALDETASQPITATGESGVKAKDVTGETSLHSSVSSSPGKLGTAVPAEVAANDETKPGNKKLESERAKPDEDKNYESTLAKEAQIREELKEQNENLDEKEKDKTRYATNTVWVNPSAGAGNDTKKPKTEDNRNDNGDGIASNNNANISLDKAEEKVVYEKHFTAGPESKKRAKKGEAAAAPAQPDSIVNDMLAGYSYYDQKTDKGIVQGGEPPKAQAATTPVQSQSTATTTKDIAQKQSEPMPAQKTNHRGSGKGQGETNNYIADIQDAEPPSPARGNVTEESAGFSGGKDALQQYVKKNLKISSPKKTGIIEAEFTVTRDGKVDPGSVKITKKIKDCNPCSEDVVELVKSLPKLDPPMEKGKSVTRKQKISVKYNADSAK